MVDPPVHSRYEAGWSKDSYLILKLSNDIAIGRFTLDKYGRRVQKFNPTFQVPRGSTWKYSNAEVENWTSSSFNDGSWSASSQGAFPWVADGEYTRYYRATVSLPDLTGYSSFELSVNSRYGLIMYVNGEEIYRNNLPTVGVTESTPSQGDDSSYEYRRAFASRYLLTPTTVLAVEVHFPSGHTNMEDHFDAFFSLVYGNSFRAFDGSTSGTHQTDYTGEYGVNSMDDQRINKWFMNSLPAYTTYTFNKKRAEFVNMYKIIYGDYDTGRRPVSFTLEGSNDGTNWDMLDYRYSVTPANFKAALVFTMPQIRHGYRMFKITIAASGSTQSELSDISLYAIDLPLVDTVIDYGRSYTFFPGQTVKISPTAKGFKQWLLDTALPSGLTLNADNGDITGTVSTSATLGFKKYDVLARRVETGSTLYIGSVNITIDTCTGENRRLKLVKTNGVRRGTESVVIKQGDVVLETFVTPDDTGNNAASSHTVEYCLPSGLYTMEFIEETGLGWSDGSYVTLSTMDGEGNEVKIGNYGGIKGGDSFKFALGSLTMTAQNLMDSTLGVISTSVTVDCEATSEYPALAHGESMVTSCPPNYIGYGRVRCIEGEFTDIELDHCSIRSSTIFTFGFTTLHLLTGVAMTPMTLLADANFNSLTIDKELPAGLVFRGRELSGIPTEATETTVYTFTGENPAGTVTTTLTITVEDNSCAAIDSFPATCNGCISFSFEGCPEHMHGRVSRVCTNGLFGPLDMSECIYDSVTGLQYLPTSFTFTAGESIVIDKPDTNGFIYGFSISPNTPLTISSTGEIIGVLPEAGSYSFTITAWNPEGSIQTTISITINPKPCTIVNGISIVSGQRVLSACPSYHTGNAYRICRNGVLSAVQYDECVLLPPSGFSYSSDEITIPVYSSFNTGFPTYSSIVESFSITPYNSEVIINRSTGTVGGLPTEEGVTVFTITASNAAGSTSFELTLRAVGLTCPAMKDVPETAVGESYSFDCTTLEGYKGVSTHTCLLSADQRSAKWSTPSEFCQRRVVRIDPPIILIFLFSVIIFGCALFMRIQDERLNLLPILNRRKVPTPSSGLEEDDAFAASSESDVSSVLQQILSESEAVSVEPEKPVESSPSEPSLPTNQ